MAFVTVPSKPCASVKENEVTAAVKKVGVKYSQAVAPAFVLVICPAVPNPDSPARLIVPVVVIVPPKTGEVEPKKEAVMHQH